MKKMLVTAAAALVLSASLAMAAPATPVFNTPTKVGEGITNYERNKKMAFDGANIYAGYASDGTVRVAKSDNNGTTWGLSQKLEGTVATDYVQAESVVLAVSNDPLYAGKKLVHAIWYAADSTVSWPNGNIIYYAYKADRPTQTGWSTPARIDMGVANGSGGGGGTSLAVTSNGAIHILYNNSYITAASPDSTFSSPTALPFQSDGQTYMKMDSTNNLYVAYVINNEQLMFTKKAASASTWSTPVAVYTTAQGNLSRNIDLVVLNSSTYYIAFQSWVTSNPDLDDLNLLVSTNSGSTWTKRTVLANTPDGNNKVNVAVSSTKVISYVSEVYGGVYSNPSIKVWRSNDAGATWSAPATIKGQRQPYISLDSAGKANIFVMDEVDMGSYGPNTNLLWIKEK